MDSQAIGPAAGVTATVQPQAHAQTTAAARSGAADRRTVNDTQAANEPATRIRDPRSLQYEVDRDTHQVVATIVDENDQTVVRRVPSEEVVRIAKAIDRMQGFLHESKA